MLGKKIDNIDDLLGIFDPEEGSINFYYGRIGSGKTYSATADILDLLEKGQVVYCNWLINWGGFDERTSFTNAFFKFFFFQNKYFNFPVKNLHYIDMEGEKPCPSCGVIHTPDIKFFSTLTDCHIFIDEGQWIFDSRSRLDKDWRKMILHTRHLNRSINIVSQRTQAVEVSARGQVNRFFKCEKVMMWPWLIFRRTEYQDMKNDDVDDGETAEPISKKVYFARRKVMQAYDSHYLRAGMSSSQRVYFEAYQLNFIDRLGILLLCLIPEKIKRTFYKPKIKLSVKSESKDNIIPISPTKKRGRPKKDTSKSYWEDLKKDIKDTKELDTGKKSEIIDIL